jgi:hypothetical protein
MSVCVVIELSLFSAIFLQITETSAQVQQHKAQRAKNHEHTIKRGVSPKSSLKKVDQLKHKKKPHINAVQLHISLEK